MGWLMRLGGILCVVVVLLIAGLTADVQAQDQTIYEYVDATGEKVIVNEIESVPEDRRQTIRRLVHDPAELAKERQLDRDVEAAEERKNDAVQDKGTAPGPGAPAADCKDEAEWSFLTWLDFYKFYLIVIVVTIVLMFLLPGIKWRGIVGILAAVLVGTLVIEQFNRRASDDPDCDPASVPILSPQEVERQLDKSVSERERRQKERLLEAE
jgi:hypothetical protein